MAITFSWIREAFTCLLLLQQIAARKPVNCQGALAICRRRRRRLLKAVVAWESLFLRSCNGVALRVVRGFSVGDAGRVTGVSLLPSGLLSAAALSLCRLHQQMVPKNLKFLGHSCRSDFRDDHVTCILFEGWMNRTDAP